MTELFIHLIGTCALYWCSFSIDFEEHEAFLVVKAYNQYTKMVVDQKRFSINGLIFNPDIEAFLEKRREQQN